MKINIKFMTEAAYRTLCTNYDEVYNMIKTHPSDSSWLKDYLGFEPYEEKKYFIEDFTLLNKDENSNARLENAKILYEKLNKLPRYILCSNRFWGWLTFEKAYKQAIDEIDLKGSQIIKSWWLVGSSRRDLMLGVMSRNYFRAEISYDAKRTNPYELTEYLLDNSECYRNLVFRNIGMLKNVSLGFISAQKEIYELYKRKLAKDEVRDSMKIASRLGSVKLIDMISEKEVHDAIYNYLNFKRSFVAKP